MAIESNMWGGGKQYPDGFQVEILATNFTAYAERQYADVYRYYTRQIELSGKQAFFLSYEMLSESYMKKSVMKQVFRFLDLRADDEIMRLYDEQIVDQTHVTKQAHSTQRDMVRNYDKLRADLKGTKWEKYLTSN